MKIDYKRKQFENFRMTFFIKDKKLWLAAFFFRNFVLVSVISVICRGMRCAKNEQVTVKVSWFVNFLIHFQRKIRSFVTRKIGLKRHFVVTETSFIILMFRITSYKYRLALSNILYFFYLFILRDAACSLRSFVSPGKKDTFSLKRPDFYRA